MDAYWIAVGSNSFAIGLRLLNVKNVAIGNLLPALAVAPLLALVVHQLS